MAIRLKPASHRSQKPLILAWRNASRRDDSWHSTCFVLLSIGYTHACAALVDGSVYCWGRNESGQLGTNDGMASNTPRLVPGVANVLRVASGSAFSCAVAEGGGVWCWGNNSLSQCGFAASGAVSPVRVTTTIKPAAFIAAGVSHACTLNVDRTASCWGNNDSAQLGFGTMSRAEAPRVVPSLGTLDGLVANSEHTCAFRNGGSLLCWGFNANGALGDGGAYALSPTVYAAIDEFQIVGVAAGSDYTCARSRFGTAKCWGGNGNGQLGNGDTIPQPLPVAVSNFP